MYHGDWMAPGAWVGWIFWVIILAAIIWLIVRVVSSGQKSDITQEKTPIEILKTRYANGEISKEEFDQIKKDLES